MEQEMQVGKRIRQVRQPWPALKEQFVRRRLNGESLSLAAFAAERGTDRRTMERHSSRENWLKAVEERAQERLAVAREYSAKLVELNQYHLHMWRSGFRIR
jgi:hypothetical protein